MSKAALRSVNAEDSYSSEALHRGETSILDVLRERGERQASPRHVTSIEASTVVPSDLLLARAIDAMERRTLRSKQRADHDSQPCAKEPQDLEAHREGGRVYDLAQRVSDIETRLVDRFAPVEDNPVGLALARLEARLDTFTRQSSLADAIAVQQTFAQLPTAVPQAGSFQRLEDKLDAILKALEQRTSETSSIALAACYSARRRDDRRLGEAIDQIARRQEALADEDVDPRFSRQPGGRRTDRAFPLPRHVPRDDSSLKAIRCEIAELVAKVDGLRHDVSVRRAAANEVKAELDQVCGEFDAMSRTLRDVAAADDTPSLIDAVAATGDRIATSQDLTIGEATREGLVSVLGETRRILMQTDGDDAIADLADRLQVTERRIGASKRGSVDESFVAELRSETKDLRELVAAAGAKPQMVQRVERLIASLNDLLDEPQARFDTDFEALTEELRDITANLPSRIAFARIEIALDALDSKLVHVGPESKSPAITGVSQEEIEKLLRDLSRKMDAAQAPSADSEALNALQGQIALLASRFEGADDGLVKLNGLQDSMRDVFAHLEQTRASVETSAAKAAREVLRIAVEQGEAQRAGAASANLVKLQSMQDEAEARTRSALSAVQDTLTKVVDRLSIMEGEVVEVRQGNKTHILAKSAPAKASAIKLSEISLGTPDPALDQTLGRKSSPKIDKTIAEALAAGSVELGGPNGRADFIAAARRAAKSVQDSLSASEMQRPPTPTSESKPNVGLIAPSRDYLSHHKKPALLGIAALVFILGAITASHRFGWRNGEIQTAALVPAVHVATTKPVGSHEIAPAGKNLASLALQPQASGAASPAAKSAPLSQAVGPGLPMFATRAPVPPPPPTIPQKLKAMAEAGDAGAEYVLGVQYAEGHGASRDFKVAANWYQKAADKGIVPAQYRLASLYEKGLGVAKDKVKARGLYLQAAEAGNPRAMHNLAVLLADGDGKPDYEGAATWFRKAAQLGMEDSQYNLAILLARGLGVQQSLVQSYQWFAIAAAQSDADAAKKRDEVGSRLGTADLAVAKALAASFRPRAVSVAATEVQPPPGGWDGASTPTALNSARPKISSL